METVKLNNGIEMPIVGYGVYQISPDECERCVTDAIATGYRLIDTAQAYHNEEGVGRAIAKSGIAREQFFITTKIWLSHYGEAKAAESIDESLRRLGTDYIDLLLLHQPFNDYYGAYRAMEAACRAGKVRAIGVSNFYPDRFIDLAEHVAIKPAVNQVETHVFNQQKQAREIMQRYGTRPMAWGPFAEGLNNFFDNETLQAIGQAHGKTVAQTALRFLIQQGVIVIPKSTHLERMQENIDIFDFSLTDDEMQQIAGLDLGHSLFFSHYDPNTVDLFMQWEKSI